MTLVIRVSAEIHATRLFYGSWSDSLRLNTLLGPLFNGVREGRNSIQILVFRRILERATA